MVASREQKLLSAIARCAVSGLKDLSHNVSVYIPNVYWAPSSDLYFLEKVADSAYHDHPSETAVKDKERLE